MSGSWIVQPSIIAMPMRWMQSALGTHHEARRKPATAAEGRVPHFGAVDVHRCDHADADVETDADAETTTKEPRLKAD